jgi:hypothetical protein
MSMVSPEFLGCSHPVKPRGIFRSNVPYDFHPSYLALRPSPKVRHRQYRTLLVPSADPRADARDPRWTTRRAVGGAAPLGGWPMDPGARKVKVVSFYHGQTARLR